MILIIDYELGNLRSVAGAVERVGYTPVISNKVEDLEKADKLILPGVGAFGDGMANLRRLNLIGPLRDQVLNRNKPILGICLGAQLLANDSEEFGFYQGLGFIDASVRKINPNGSNLRIPHVGWNDLVKQKENILFEDIPMDALFYYVHSFHIQCNIPETVIGTCTYGIEFTAAFNYKNIYGTQFHPEKSQLYGLYLLKNFLDQG